MRRTGMFLAAILLAIGTTARAGEMDDEFGTKGKASPAAPSVVATANPGSELDGESPAQACFFGRRWGFGGFGYGRGFGGFGGFGLGFGRFGYGGFGFGYPFGFGGFGYGRGFGGFGYGRGFGGFGYGRGFGGYGFRRGFW